ncbi:cathepsin L-like proteinase [Brassica napus]|nr:cathepsin L-like proteinase [Brassica napus]
MEEAGESSEPQLANVLVDIPNKHLHVLNEIIKLVDPDLQPLVADVLHIVPKEILLDMIRFTPESEIRIIECLSKENGSTKRVRYASWMKRQLIPEFLKGLKWKDLMGAVVDQKEHDVCWAIVVAELIRALRQIDGRDADVNIRYSAQELIDFVDPEQRRVERKKEHYCYPLNLTKGFEYVMKNGIQREEDRPFSGCPRDVPDHTPSSQLGYIKDFVRLKTIDEVLIQLKKHPIGAALAIFQPEYKNIGKKIYRGPVSQDSKLRYMHAVSLVDVGEENGEKYVLARTSHGDDFGDGGYIKISLEIVLVYIPTPGEDVDETAKKYFSKPRSLLGRFSYPRLLTEAEEEIQKKIHQDKQFSCDEMEL